MMEVYKCSECDKSFFQKRYLQAHFKRMHDKSKSVPIHENEDQADEENEVFPCIYCEKKFTSKNSESKHRIRTHGQYNSLLNICCQEAECTEKFMTLSAFRIHLKEHHNFKEQDLSEEKTFDSKDGKTLFFYL